MSGWRKIVVDDIEYRWRYGLGMVLVRCDDKSFAKYDTTKLLGLTNDEHERAIWKRSMYASVMPSVVADAIRESARAMSCR